MMWFGKNITPEQTRVPKKVFAIMGALDGLSGIMQVFASTYLGGSLIILLTQARFHGFYDDLKMIDSIWTGDTTRSRFSSVPNSILPRRLLRHSVTLDPTGLMMH